MKANVRFKTISIVMVSVVVLATAGYGWSKPSSQPPIAFPSPPSQSQAEAFARQDALRYTTDEVCDDYRNWPVVYDFDAPVYTETKYTLALMEALADAGFVTRRIVPKRNAGPVQFYPHEKRIYDIVPQAKPYVREQRNQAGPSGAGGSSKALCFGRYVYDHFTSLEADLFVGDSSDRSRINGSVYKDLNGAYRTDVRYSIRAEQGFEEWANSIDRRLHGHKVRNEAEYYPFRRLGDMTIWSTGLEKYVSLEYIEGKWKFAPKP
ncbi:hypothetical protein G3O00_19400 [Burkholderia sp. Ac-20384]|uniref:hypothetical protein n=1 Tax=Burkholderia sp. Ac-20384 TaxID=2703902 RepID=UPI001981093E|nr:hypothetical protein [Burkholderia sp. Ac-20384]MBN3825776.1 hypothetical protein [Burkholderia sp. Ac-20384]